MNQTALPWLATLIRRLRPDLCKLMKLDDDNPASRQKLLGWLVTTGVHEYKSLLNDPFFTAALAAKMPGQPGLSLLQQLIRQERADVRAAFPDGRGTDFLQWFYTHGVEEHNIWPWLTETERRRVLAQPEPWPERIRAAAAASKTFEPPLQIPLIERPFGVNLVGYAYGQLGIGEDVRMAARALLSAGVPATMINFEPGADIPQNDRSMAEHVTETGEFAFNIFCMTALENGRYYAEQGPDQFSGRYNIGYWPWELGRWPEEWRDLTRLVDEVWVSSRHTYNALAPVSPVPVYIMPMAVELGKINRKGREFFGLPATAKLFCFAFDLGSSIHRKNPQACIDAFLRAFPKTEFASDRVGLVIKAHRPARRRPAWEKLKALAARDDRIHIIETTLPRPDLLALYKSCDCFVSLHRAEGFGRSLAEALQLGLHVIATGYSGNMDFCAPPDAEPVRYKLIKLKKGQYPYGEKQVWAQPDIRHAAGLMRSFAERDKMPEKTGWPQFSVKTAGARYKKRLETIRHRQMASNTSEPASLANRSIE